MALRFMQGLYSFVLVLITALLARYFTEQGMISFYRYARHSARNARKPLLFLRMERNLRFVVFELFYRTQVAQNFGTV